MPGPDATLLTELVKQDRADINALTGAVSRVTALVESGEKRHAEVLTSLQSLDTRMDKLTNAISTMDAMKSDISQVKEDVRVAAHDAKGALSYGQAVVANAKDVAGLTARINGLETWKTEIVAGAKVFSTGAQIFWAVFGTGFLGIGAWLLMQFFGGGHAGAISDH